MSDSADQEGRPENAILSGQGTLGPLLRLAAPVVTEQLLLMMVMLVDVYLVGHYIKGAPELAAVGLIGYTIWLLTNVFEFICIGTTAVIARCIGAGELGDARRIANQSLVLGAILAFAVVVAGELTAATVVGWMQLEGEAARLAVRYLEFIWPIMPLMMIERVGIACLRASGRMGIIFVVMAIVNVVNVLVSSVLATGWQGFPNWGWDGVAVGTSVAHATAGVIVFVLMLRGSAGLGLSWRLLKPNWHQMRRILRIGVPGGIDVLSVIGCHMVYLALINDLGVLAAAAHNVAVQLESMSYLPGAGIAVAATTLTGQFLGAGDRQRASRCLVVACLVGSAVMMAVGVFFWFGGEMLALVFLAPQDATSAAEATKLYGVASESAQLLKIAAYAMLPLALQMILTGGLRGAGDTRWPLVFSLIGMAGLRIPLAYVFTNPEFFDLGVTGAWWAMFVDMIVRCSLIVWRFRHGGWLHVRV